MTGFCCQKPGLGYVTDVEVDVKDGRVIALIVPCCGKPLTIFHREELVIPWGWVKRIGDDIILIEGDLDKCRLPRPKREFF